MWERGSESLNERERALSAIVNIEGFDHKVLEHLRQLMNDCEYEILGSPSASNQTILCRRNFWVVKNLFSKLLLHVTGIQDSPLASYLSPPNAPSRPTQFHSLPLSQTIVAHQGKTTSTPISVFKNTEPLLVKTCSSNSTSSTFDNDDDARIDTKGPGVEGGKRIMSQLGPPIDNN